MELRLSESGKLNEAAAIIAAGSKKSKQPVFIL